MTTSAQIRTAWADVWEDSDVTDLAAKIYSYEVDLIAEESQAHAAKIIEEGDVNFIQWQVHKAREYFQTGNVLEYFTVSIQVIKEADFTGTAYNAIEDALETIHTTLLANLGSTWSSTVDFYRPQEDPVEITPIEFNGVPCWVGRYSYTGEVNTSL